jgi:hypothetical protein
VPAPLSAFHRHTTRVTQRTLPTPWGRLRVLIAGEAKRGKSTVANALIGSPVLPAGVTPLTAIATTLVHGTDEHVTVTFENGTAERRPLGDLPGLVTEPGNPGNRLGVAEVTVHLDAPLLAEGIELVETPGTGSVYEHNTRQAQRALETLDAAVMVLTADPPPSAAERDLLHKIAERSVATFVLLNKADRLDPAERSEALAFTTRIVSGGPGPTCPCTPYPRGGHWPGSRTRTSRSSLSVSATTCAIGGPRT